MHSPVRPKGGVLLLFICLAIGLGDTTPSQHLTARDEGIAGWSLVPGAVDAVGSVVGAFKNVAGAGLGLLEDAAGAGWRGFGGVVNGGIAPQKYQPGSTKGNRNTRPGSGNNRPQAGNQRPDLEQKSPVPNAQVDGSFSNPNKYAPDYHEGCSQFLEGVLKWAVCDNGNMDPDETFHLVNDLLPGFDTFTLINSFLSRFRSRVKPKCDDNAD